LAAAIEGSSPEIIIPCDDRAVEHLHELHTQARARGALGEKIASLIERSLGSPESFSIVSSRYELLLVAVAEGLRIPETRRIDGLEDLAECCAKKTLPVVLKADGTWGGNGVKVVHTPAQAEQSFLELIRKPGFAAVTKRLLLERDRFWVRPWRRYQRPTVIAQSYVQGRPANCAAFCWEGRVLALIGVEVVSTQGEEQERPATVVRVVDNEEMNLAAQRLARRLGLSGFFGLDFMIEEGTEATYLIEMNPRCTKLTRLGLGPGRDMITALWVELAGKPHRAISLGVSNSTIAYFPEAWNFGSQFLESSYPDIPMGEVELIRELLRPTSERTLLGHIVDGVRGLCRAWNGRAFGKRFQSTRHSRVSEEDFLTDSARG
jgi:hypothetical protein